MNQCCAIVESGGHGCAPPRKDYLARAPEAIHASLLRELILFDICHREAELP